VVDIGHSDARVWLSKRGAKYGLCQIYHNQPLALRTSSRSHRSRLPCHV